MRDRGRGAWPWLLQRVSALALLILVVTHLWTEHFMHLGQTITYHGVAARLMHAAYDAVDYALLIVVVYHALNGFRSVLFDRIAAPALQRLTTGLLWLVGIATVVLGGDILSAFLDGRAWFYL